MFLFIWGFFIIVFRRTLFLEDVFNIDIFMMFFYSYIVKSKLF